MAKSKSNKKSAVAKAKTAPLKIKTIAIDVVEVALDSIRDEIEDACKDLPLDKYIELLQELKECVEIYLDAAEDDVKRKARQERDT